MPIADANGEVRLNVETPAGLPAGARRFRVVGNQGTVVEGVYVGSFQSVFDLGRWPSQHIVTVNYEPLAQTFTLNEARIIGAIEVEVCAIGATIAPLRIQIRETTVGIPNNVCLGESLVYVDDFVASPGLTRFVFDPPIPLNANQEYAFVVITSDPGHKLAYARIGELEEGSETDIVTLQPYQVGVLLLSSNAKTWTPIQDADLRFKVLACKFAPATKTVELGVVDAAAVTDMKVKANVWRPFGIADAHFEVTPLNEVGVGVANLNPEDNPIQLTTRHAGNVRVRAVLYGDEKSSPIIAPNTQLVIGNLSDSAEYGTVEFKAALSFSVKVAFDCLRKTGSTIRAFIAVQRMAGNAEVYENGQPQYDWVELIEQESSLALGDGWTEEVWILKNLRGIGLDRLSRARLVLTGGPAGRPAVDDLRVILT